MSVERRNPLFNSKITTAASSNVLDITKPQLNAPISPVTGIPMRRSMCRDVPVWFCDRSRIVLPMAKAASTEVNASVDDWHSSNTSRMNKVPFNLFIDNLTAKYSVVSRDETKAVFEGAAFYTYLELLGWRAQDKSAIAPTGESPQATVLVNRFSTAPINLGYTVWCKGNKVMTELSIDTTITDYTNPKVR